MAYKINKKGAKINALLDKMDSLDPKATRSSDGFMSASDKEKLEDLPSAQDLIGILAEKQDVITDLPAIRSGAEAGASAYQKPGTGIPASDLSSEVQDMIENGGKTKSISVNGGTPVTPDENGQVDLTVPSKTSDLENDSDFATKQEAQQMVDDAKIDTVSVDYQEDGGAPDASASFEDGELAFSLKNMKMKFSDLTAADKAELKGDKGDKGDSFQPIEDVSGLALAHTIGQDNTKAMSQKGVTDVVTMVSKTYTDTEINATSRYYYIGNNTWMSDPSANPSNEGRKIDISAFKGKQIRIAANSTSGTRIAFIDTLPSSAGETVDYCEGTSYIDLAAGEVYGAIVPQDCNWLYMAHKFGGPIGTPVKVEILDTIKERVAAIEPYIPKDDNIISMSEKFSVSRENVGINDTTVRYYIYINKELPSPCKLRYLGETPEGIEYAFQGFNSLNDVKSSGTIEPVESSGSYGNTLREYDFTCKFLRIAFKASSGNPTTAQKSALRTNTILEVIPLGLDNAKGVILRKANEMVYPIMPSKGIVHKGSTLDQYLDMAVFYKECPLDSMGKSSPVVARRRYTVKVLQTPFYASIEGSVPSGFICDLQTNYTLADAQSPYVAQVQGSGWGGRSAYFDAENAYYVTIGWKKLDNSAFTAEDIAALEASNVRLLVKNFSSGDDDDRTDIISLNDEKKTLTYLRNAKRPQYKGSTYSPTTTPCTLLHFSDIHADEPNMKRIVQFYNHYKAYIDDALCTGDIIQNLFGDSFAFWENAEAGLILNCTGNHEYYNGEHSSPYYKQITQKQVYDKFFAPYIEYWSVTQPTDAEENGLNYYYKDYTTSKVRLIVLDNMRVDETQIAWFEEVLADAITNNYHVVAAMHIGNPVGWVKYDNPFNSLKENNPSPLNAWVFADSELLYDKVDEFIGNNGVFVGWLMGHIHSDTIGTPQGHPNQLEIHVATGSCGSAWDIIPKGDNCDRTPGSKSQDCFNIYSIDTYYKMIRIHRIGCDVDRDFRHIGNLCYDYENHRVIYVD